MIDTRVPDYIEPVIAWRSWLLVSTSEGVRLSSVIHPMLWPPRRELLASCRRRRPRSRGLAAFHSAPERACQCGIYGAGHLSLLRPYLERQPAERDQSERTLGRAIGRVRLWGTVVECSQGWRASHAYPAAIYVSSAAHKAQLLEGERLSLALAAYGIPIELLPCETLSEIAEALADWPAAA
jgi:hypothetical protein